jgi:hypothetical protein
MFEAPDHRLDRDQIARVLAPPKRSAQEGEGLLDGVVFRRRVDGYIAPIEKHERTAPRLHDRVIGSFHEASHAVTALTLGQRIRGLSLNDDGSGYCRLQPSITRDRKALLHYLAVASAGAVAVRRLTGREDRCGGDHQRMEARLSGLSVRDAVQAMRNGRALAERIVAEHWTDIAILARRLHACGEMDGIEVANVLPEIRVAA